MENQTVPTPDMTFEQFFDQYYFRFVDYWKVRTPGDDAEELVQEAFVSLWEHWDRLESHAEFVLFSWTKKALALLSKANFRKRAKEGAPLEFDERIDEAYPQVMREAEPSVEESVVENEAYRQYLAEINKRLSQSDRRLFACMIRSMSLKETAKALSKSEKAISVGISRLREKLRRKILPEILPKENLL